MKIFKTIDEKFEDIGFKKIKDDKYAVTYERYDGESEYMQILDIRHKKNGKHVIQSYNRDLFNMKRIGDTRCWLNIL